VNLEDSQVLPENGLDFTLGECELICGKQDVGYCANKRHGAKGENISLRQFVLVGHSRVGPCGHNLISED
jgi:hypothetical protein